MLAMYTRRLTLPPRPFLLLGPRGTGKTTWLRRHLPQAQWYNLLLDRELLRLMREPGAFGREIEVKASERWRPEFARALNELHANGAIRRAFGVYLGARPMQDGAVRVLPIAAFLRELAGGRVLATTR